jgi:tRNA nucleotidyltransferase (CCA-adding enzyme)
VVGGWVRDQLIDSQAAEPNADFDVEIHGLDPSVAERLLGRLGRVIHVGRAFGVMRVRHYDVDFSLPRRDSLSAADAPGGSTGAARDSDIDPHLGLAEAARRRDLTINSMAWDPLSGELIDPHGGLEDLEHEVLRATDPARFGDDPLRGLRVAQFIARFGFEPDPELRGLCAGLDLDEVSKERIFEELRKLLLKGERPSAGLDFVREVGLLRLLPELAALVDVPQDAGWHPEGCVWTHTLMVLDEAAQLRSGEARDDLALMLGALCHDLGKPETTTTEGGQVRSPRHEQSGVDITRRFLGALRAPGELVTRVEALVRHHLAPARLVGAGAHVKAYRRLARKLDAAGVATELLYRLAKADHLGRTTEDALARSCEPVERFYAVMQELELEGPRDVVQGRDVVARGIPPGPRVGAILERCKAIQDETGSSRVEEILGRALAEEGS